MAIVIAKSEDIHNEKNLEELLQMMKDFDVGFEKMIGMRMFTTKKGDLRK